MATAAATVEEMQRGVGLIKVLVVDDHDLVRTGISRMLADIDGLKVIGEAESGEEALQKARELKPDVVLMDVKMPGIGGLEATGTRSRHACFRQVLPATSPKVLRSTKW